MLWLVIIGWILLSFSSCRSSDKAVGRELTASQLLTETLPPDQTQTYRFTAPAQQLFRVSIVHTSARLKLKLFNTNGNLIREIESLDYAPTPLSLIIPKSETYRLEISSAEPANTTPLTYRLQIAEPRPVSESDMKQLEAEVAFAEGNRLARKGDVKSVQAAILQFQKAQSGWENSGDNRNLALVQKSLGQAYSYLYENVTAQTHALKALEYVVPLNDEQLKAGILNDLCLIEVNLNETEKAKQHGTLALEISQKNQFRIEEAAAYFNIGEVHYAFGDRQRMMESTQQALRCWNEIQDRRGQAQALLNIGYIYNDWREIDQARNYFHQALQLWNSLSDKRGQALTLMAIGNVHARIGENQETLKFYDQALPGLEQTGARLWEASILLNTGFIHHSYGNYDQALELYERARQIHHDIKNIENEAGALYDIGWIYQLKNEPQKAMTYLNQALSLCEEISEKKYASQIIRKIGDVYFFTGEHAKANKYYHQALLRHREGGEKLGEAEALNSIGQLHFQNGKKKKALEFFEASLSINRTIGARFAEAQNLYNLALLAKSQNNFAAANDRILEAIKVIESLRSGIINQQLRTSYFAVVHQIFQLSIDIWMQQQTRPDQYAKESFTISEQSRARSLFDLLNESRRSIKQGVSPQLLEKERALQQNLNIKADRKLKIADQKNKEPELAALTKEIDDLTTQLDDIRSKIRATSPRYAALTQPQPLKADEIQQLLDDDTLLLEYSLGDERSYLWAVSRQSIEAFTLPKRATIEPLVHQLLELMTAPVNQTEESAAQWQARLTKADQDYWSRADKLSQILLGPVAAKLGRQRLIIVGDGVLQRLPFAVLPKPNDKGGTRNNEPNEIHRSPFIAHPLVSDHEITYQPSASSLKLLREDRARPVQPAGWLARWSQSLRTWWNGNKDATSPYSVAVLADPVFGLEDKRVKFKEVTAAPTNQPLLRDVDLMDENTYFPRLAATREEAAAIQKAAGTKPVLVKQGFEVNRSLLESESLQSYSILHLATHGYWDSTNPELSAIVLSRVDAQGKQLEDGTLRLSDIYNLNLRKELVVLSACETAVGKDIQGEGLVALTRGFMYAGATRVMASLWKVEDSATAAMMKEFYQHLLQEGLSPAAALRQAQITMWKKHPTEVPYKWAAFVLQGEYR